jgi:endonuclease/exonuclease/phosphatase (EEP) superfamily protein YafD
MGDFNAASWSPLLIALRGATGLEERRRLLPSWPSWAWPIFRLPIDHVLARGRARVVESALGPDIGSDHLPIIARIAIEQ